ncbi:MAG: Rpn family recombination-promoting nuclease/putative transposase [Lachnospiraceae bacterium]|nr:Rpn family recombination-promoting nuclease/putative transposase [Lachnospiraceae bacterium]
MGTKDAKAKEFLSDNERFADLFNYYLFGGRQVIRPEDLEERDTTEVLSLYGRDKKEIQKQKWRDLLKHAIIKATKTAVFVLLGIENQSDIHYAMPVKNMSYDVMNYGAQVTEASARHKKDKEYSSDAEFLSGFRKEDRLTPVITLTVYWGADEWDAPRSLHEMFAVSDPQILKYVDDYHLHLIVPGEITDFDRFRTSLREVLEIIKASDDRKKMKEVLEGNPRFKSLENEAVSAINVFTGLKIPVNKKERKTDMCKAWEDQRRIDKAEGKIEGKAEDTIDLLEDIGELSTELRRLIMEQTDLEVLKNWLKLAARAKSIEEFEKVAGLLERV